MFQFNRFRVRLVAGYSRPEAVVAIDRARARGPERHLVLFTALRAGDGIGLAISSAKAATATAAKASTATAIVRRTTRATAIYAALRLVGIALLQVILLIVD